MNEIKTNNEMVTFNEVEVYFKRLAEKAGLELDKFNTTKYISSCITPSYHCENEEYFLTVKATCGIRTMGTFSTEDMIKASEEIKAIAKVVETFNERMDGVKVTLK